MKIEDKINKMGIKIPEAAKPVASYVPFRRVGNLIYISGQDCRVNGKLKYEGKVGKDVTEKEAYEAARITAINLLAILKSAIGNLDNLVKIVNLHGFVNSADGFVRQPMVINGASDILLEVFGEKGKHSRCALSANELPNNTPVEIEMIVEVE